MFKIIIQPPSTFYN